MNDPNKKPDEPQRTSQPMKPQPEPQPMEAPGVGGSEYEREVPHPSGGNQPIARTGESGEGSYQGTRQYDDGLRDFSKRQSPATSIEKGKRIDVDDPELKRAEAAGREPAQRRTSDAGGKPRMRPDEGRPSHPGR